MVDRPTSKRLCSASSRRLRQLARGLCGLQPLAVGLDLQRRVGDFGRNLQLELPGLRDRLPLLQPGASQVRLGRAGANRIAEVHREVPRRRSLIREDAQRVGVAAREWSA